MAPYGGRHSEGRTASQKKEVRFKQKGRHMRSLVTAVAVSLVFAISAGSEARTRSKTRARKPPAVQPAAITEPAEAPPVLVAVATEAPREEVQTPPPAVKAVQPAPANLDPSGRPWRLNALTVSPVGLAMGYYGLEYERALSRYVSVLIAPGMKSTKGLSAYGGDAGIHLFPMGEGLRGVWMGLEGGLSKTTQTFFFNDVPLITLNYTAWAVRGMVGYSWAIADTVALSIGGGVAYNSTKTVLFGQPVTLNIPAPALRGNLGWAF